MAFKRKNLKKGFKNLFSAGGGKKPFWETEPQKVSAPKKDFTAAVTADNSAALWYTLKHYKAKPVKIESARGMAKFRFSMTAEDLSDLKKAIEKKNDSAEDGAKMLVRIRPVELQASI